MSFVAFWMGIAGVTMACHDGTSPTPDPSGPATASSQNATEALGVSSASEGPSIPDVVGAPSAGSAEEPTFRTRLRALPLGFGGLVLGGAVPDANCWDQSSERGQRSCRTKDPAVLGGLEADLGVDLAGATLVDREGVIESLTLFVTGCSATFGDPVGDGLRDRLGLGAVSPLRASMGGWVARQDAGGTVVRLENDVDDQCLLELAEAEEPTASDATYSDGEVIGQPGPHLAPEAWGAPIADDGYSVDSAMLTDSGLLAVLRRGAADDGTLTLQPMALVGSTWKPSGDGVPVPTLSWGVPAESQQVEPDAVLSMIGAHWAVVELSQRLCQGGSDPCHAHRTAEVFTDQTGAWQHVGGLPTEVTGVYGSDQCELQHFRFDRELVESDATHLRMRLRPAARRALCNANDEGCEPGPDVALHLTAPIAVDLVATAGGVELEAPSALTAARGVHATGASPEVADTLVSLLDWSSRRFLHPDLSPAVVAWSCLGGGAEPVPAADQAEIRSLAVQVVDQAALPTPTRDQLRARIDQVEGD